MKRFNRSIVLQFDTDSTGNSGALLPVTVRDSTTQIKPTLYNADNAIPANEIANPVTSDELGNYTFFVGDGVYDVIINEDLSNTFTLKDEQIFDSSSSGGGGGVGVLLSDYWQSGDVRLTTVWDRMIVDLQNTSSPNYGKLLVALGNNPAAPDGVWLHDTPATVPASLSGLQVFGGSVNWVNTNETRDYRRKRGMFEAIGSTTESVINVTADIVKGANTLTLASVAGIVKGGYVNIIFENAIDQTTGVFPIIYDFAEVLDIDGLVITIGTVIDWDITLTDNTANTVQFFEDADVPKDIMFHDIDIIDTGTFVVYNTPPTTGDAEQPAYVIGPYFFQFCARVNAERVRGTSLKCPLVQYREYTDCFVKNSYSNLPLAIGPGEGYVVQMSRGNKGLQQRNGGYQTRHVGDFTSVYDGQMLDCWDDTTFADDPERVSFLLHGRYESKLVMRNLRGIKLGLGAGFQFGNFMQDILFDDLDVEKFEGRGAIGICHINNSHIGFMNGSFYWETITMDSTVVDTGDVTFRIETRLAMASITPIDTNGAYFTGINKTRMIAFNDFANVAFDEGGFHHVGGAATSAVLMTNIARTVLNGRHINKSYKFVGACKSISFPETAEATLPNPSADGFVSASSITNELIVDLNGKLTSEYVGGLAHRTMKFQIGGGSTYHLHLNTIGFRCLGQWNDGGQIFNDLTLSGSMSNCYFENEAPFNFIETPNTKKAFTPTFKASNNIYTDDANNFDNINHSYKEAMVFNSIPANGTKTITLPTHTFITYSTSEMVMSFSWLDALNTNITVEAVYKEGTDIKVRARNYSGGILSLAGDLGLNYSIL